MMDSNGKTRDLPAKQIKKEFECDIVYEPIKREIAEEDSSNNELDDDQSDSDDEFYETIEPGPQKKSELQSEYKDFGKSEKEIVKNVTKLLEEEPCKIKKLTDEIFESGKELIHDKNYNLSCLERNILTKPKLISESSGLESDLKNALENPTYEVDCDQKEGLLIMKMINDKFSLTNKHSSSHSKSSLTDKVECKTEIVDDDLEIVYEDITWDDSSENKAIVISEVRNKRFRNETGSNLDLTDDVVQSGSSPEEKMSCSSSETTKGSDDVPVFLGDMDKATVIKQNLSTSKDKIKMLKVLLTRNFGLSYPNQNNGVGSLMHDSPRQFDDLESPKRTQKEKDQGSFECGLCLKSFISRNSMLRHYRKHSEERPQCAICSRTFYSKEYLLSHIRIIHKGELSFQCKICSKSFHKRCSLSKHERIHKRVNPYHCKMCPKSFFNKTVFTIHEKSHEEKLFNCNLCTKSFRISSTLEIHQRKHTQTFQCRFCTRFFSRVGNREVHENIHKGIRPFQCKFCPKTFSDKSHLPAHERTHSGGRPYLCKVCSKSFTQSSHLRTHEKIHIGERPFKCKICSKSFIHKLALSRHERVHKSKKEKFRDDKYHCRFCSKSFQSKNDLDCHEDTHAKEKRFRCRFCSRPYSAKSSLTAHERSHQSKKTIKSKV